eukprot:TRINITY_DN33490_c0_g1_i1.p1 TRINITY_DN33490_c0_g1~~TRINITY_DN33490_c0_g1_i1.p1  ORF type:complete len:503 (-),score=123.63 TRINITY_DN33490_c0_g1_i1:66-1547(-)
MLEPKADLEQLLGGLHEWRDVQGVIRTIFQALCDVAHAQSHAVHEVERRTSEMQEELTASLNRKADVSELRAAAAAAGDARAAADFVAQRVEEEAQSVLEAQRGASEEVQALRTGLGELRAALEKQRAEVQQWKAGFEAGLSRILSECSSDVQAAQAELKVALQQTQELRVDVDGCASVQEVQQLSEQLRQMGRAVEDKATATQLKEIVREAWTREEGHLARLQRLCESKVSAGDFASLAAVAEGKASLADVESAVQRQVQRRFQSLATDQQLMNRNDVSGIAEAAVAEAKERLRECERRIEEISRKQQRSTSAAEELRSEVKSVASTKLERAEAEALVAGALADWVRAAQQGADAVQAAVSQHRGRGSRDHDVHYRGLEGVASEISLGDSFGGSYLQAAEEAARDQGPAVWAASAWQAEGSSRAGGRWPRGPVRATGSPGARVPSSPARKQAAHASPGDSRSGMQRRPSAAQLRGPSAGPSQARARSAERRR